MTSNSWSAEAYNMGLARGVIATFVSQRICEEELCAKVKSVLDSYMTCQEVERWLKEYDLVNEEDVLPSDLVECDADVKELVKLNKEA